MEKKKIEKTAAVIKEMHLRGAPLSEIKENLKEMKVPEKDVKKVLKKADVAPTTEELGASIRKMQAKLEGGAHLKPVKKALKSAANVENKVEEMHAGLEEHRTAIGDIGGAMQGQAGQLKQIQADIRALKKQMTDFKALISALKDINEKILETNRRILIRLK